MTGTFVHSFALDEFQQRAADAIRRGENVLVAAPTGAGKTVIGEHAVQAALDRGGRAFYTTPIKALSNQKYRDLCAALGSHRVGLMTGDHVVEPDAAVVVMTTEVLRNMIYAGSDALADLAWVVLDEVHFMADAYRGAVWEEVLIHTPAGVRFACLSATVSNAGDLGGWIESLRGPTTTVIEHRRPVQLDALYLVGDRHRDEDHLVPLFVDGSPNPRGARFDGTAPGRGAPQPSGSGRRTGRSRFRAPRRTDTVERLESEGLLPAIYFVFSRNGCDDAASRCFREGLRLTTTEQAQRIRDVLDASTDALSDRDLDTLGYDTFREAASRGMAPHHAGMVPAFREGVEQCFAQGLIRVVFATETLALGINMPARSVVVEQLSKFTGDGHAMLTPAQFTQLTGRAGRRGIDDRGAAIVCWSPWVPFAQVAALAASREFPLESTFRPTYNMTANLVARYSEEQAREVLGRSFAQYGADASLHGVRTRLADLDTARRSAESALGRIGVDTGAAVHLARLVRAESALASRSGSASGEVAAALGDLRPGDLLALQDGSAERLVVVVATAQRRNRVRVDVVTPRGKVLRLDSTELTAPLRSIGHIELPVPHEPRDEAFRRESAARLRRVNPKRLATQPTVVVSEELASIRAEIDADPLSSHPDRDQALELAGDLEGIEERIASERGRLQSGGDLVARLDAVRSVLEQFGHLQGWELTASGRRLRSIFHECDLLTSLAVQDGLFADLEPRDAAALLSCITHEHRGSGRAPAPRLPTRELQERFAALEANHRELARAERAARLAETPEPSAGFAYAAWRWCDGADLGDTIGEEVSGGDFVRGARNLADLASQLARVTSGSTARCFEEATTLLQRDLVIGSGGPG